MSRNAHITGFAALLIAASLAIAAPCNASAAVTQKLGGALEGRVSDDSGKPQMGATVSIYNRQDKLLDKALTDGEGFFSFAGLTPDLYSIKVTLATFLPAIRNQIQIEAGKSSLLDVNLSGLFSSIRLLPPPRNANGIVNEDWKWVLRSSSATKPVFRYLPSGQDDPGTPVSSSASKPSLFRDTNGLVSLSAGDSSMGGGVGAMGTAFAFSTTMMGSSSIQFAGDVGYATSSAAPSAAVRTTYSRDMGGVSPEVTVTIRQLYIPRFADVPVTPGVLPMGGLPPIRTLSVSTGDTVQLTDAMALQYGIEMDTVSFVDRLHYLSPYARLTYKLGDSGELRMTFTSGNARPELAADASGGLGGELQQNVAALGDAPHVTQESGRTNVQRGEDFEIGYSRRFGSTRIGSKTLGSREIRISGYRENVQNAALMLSGNPGVGFNHDLVPDLYTDSQLFDAGNYHTAGYTLAIAQNLGDNYQMTMMYGSVGVLAPRSGELEDGTPENLRGLLRSAQRQAVTAKVSGTVQKIGTRFLASYQMMDDHAATSGHLYSTEGDQPEVGLNIKVRQPLPAIFGIPVRMEAMVDLQNMLAEGYLPITFSDGTRVLLVHTPRSLRGGLNFRF